MMGLSATKIVREAEQLLIRHSQALQAPLVIWAHLDELSEELAERCNELRARRRGCRILAAVRHGFPVPADVQAVPLPAKLFALLHPDAPSRFRIASGGRGSAKSWSYATALVLRMLARKERILCCREIMRSLRESVHHLLSETIDRLGLGQFFEINDREVSCVATGSEIIFAGLWQNVDHLKSLEGISLCWLEQAESVSDRSLEVLGPTIRATGSEIWATLNPDAADAPVQQLLESKRPDMQHVHVIFSDSPWWPPAMEADRVYMQSVDPDAYSHIYLGTTRTASDACVFKSKYFIEEFEPVLPPGRSSFFSIDADPGNPFGNLPTRREAAQIARDRIENVRYWDGPYLGADWGFSADPTTLVKIWVYQRTLYIEHEAYGIGCDIDRTPALFDTVPGARNYAIRADNARPETISYMMAHGYGRVEACKKWKGSVADGIAHLRSYERIVIHPRCTHTAEEFRLYSYRVDRLTGDVLPDLVDKHNHIIDAARYAIEPAIQRKRRGRVYTLRI